LNEEGIGGVHDGLRVVDLSSNLAGPLAAMILADLGADVIKVERPDQGDDTRGLHPELDGEGTVFLSVNRNKRSAGIDIRSDAGREAVLALAADADVVIESFAPGVAERLGLGYEQVAARNPRIVYASVSAFGEGEIGSTRPGYDALVQGFTGMMSINGHPDGPPARVAPSSIDLSTGLWLTIAIQAALTKRTADGRGRRVDVALIDSAFNLMGHQVLGMLATGVPTPRFGTESPSSTPNGAYRAADGWLVVATANDRLFRRLVDALDLPELADDPRFLTTRDRIAAREQLTPLLERRFAERPVAEWIGILAAAGVPVGPLNDLAAAVADPLTAERGLLVDPEPAARPRESPQLRLPIDPGGSWLRRPPPVLGEHTDEVLAEVGIDPSEVGGAVDTGRERR
jgi:formyl-CoA transferase/CoA:oxalate CoA-transferase